MRISIFSLAFFSEFCSLKNIYACFLCLVSAEMAGGSPLGSPVTARRTEPNGLMDPVLRDQLFNQQMLRTSPSYTIQQQMLQVIIHPCFNPQFSPLLIANTL